MRVNVSYSDKDILKILNIQAKTLRTIDTMARDILYEVASQRQFIVTLYREIKRTSGEEAEVPVDDDSEELPSNVLAFPTNEDT